jgi:hypothetical protein
MHIIDVDMLALILSIPIALGVVIYAARLKWRRAKQQKAEDKVIQLRRI